MSWLRSSSFPTLGTCFIYPMTASLLQDCGQRHTSSVTMPPALGDSYKAIPSSLQPLLKLTRTLAIIPTSRSFLSYQVKSLTRKQAKPATEKSSTFLSFLFYPCSLLTTLTTSLGVSSSFTFKELSKFQPAYECYRSQNQSGRYGQTSENPFFFGAICWLPSSPPLLVCTPSAFSNTLFENLFKTTSTSPCQKSSYYPVSSICNR